MSERTVPIFDIDLGHHDVQALNSPDAITAFFARLGYNTNARTAQTPPNLGITAETTVRPIKKIELIADQGGLFQVYLFELQSVTVVHIRALARAFRNRAGNYLLVLTSDYDRLDFVLVEKYLPPEKGNGLGLGQRQVGIRPRVLTVERHTRDRLHLRVLRRLTWTEADPFAQYDKLLSAYALADWSEEYFNNRALFSDYYLKERLQDFPEWREDPKPSYLRLRELYQAAPSRFAGKDKGKGILCSELLEPALAALGFQFRSTGRAGGATEPDYRLHAAGDGKSPLALCLAYPWDRYLDGKDDQRDKETSEENPGAVVVTLLEKGEAPWIVVTNGRLWRLYAQRTHAKATNYYEIDLEEVLAQAGPHVPDPAEAFRYFWLVFRSQAFVPVETEREGKKVPLSLLDRLLLESEDYAKKLGERLKERVFVQVFPHLAEGFISYIRKREGTETDLSQKRLDKIFLGTLTFLYRILFLLYAEARDLLPFKEFRGYFEASLSKLKREVAEAAGTIGDEVEDKLKKRYREESYELYDRLVRLFRTVDKGDPALNVPVYNGGLFLSEPDEKDDSAEAEAARFLNAMKVGDRYLARALDLLARDEDPKRHDLVFIDFKSLGVRHLGSIYEGLLEFKLRIAERKLAVVKEKGREVYSDFGGLDERARERAERQGRVVRKGHVYLENDKRERKATGSYYTPDHIVKYIVEHAVGPVLQEKFEVMRPKLREAQQKRRAFFEKQEALRKQGLRTEPESKAEFIGQELVNELFNIKVLDPAMGSGHFLVEAVDFITDKALDFLNAFPWNPVFAHLNRMREAILQEMEKQEVVIDAKRLTDVNLLKRHVLKRCIYGVDLNPMAVELAKVSLWLDCFTLGAPLSFLDHHLRCGNSLIGVTVKEVQDVIEWKKGETGDLFGSRFAGLLLAADLMRHVGELSDVTSKQVEESRSEYRKASDALAPFKRILDIYTSQWFLNSANKGKGKRKTTSENPAVAFLKTPEAETVISAGDRASLEKALKALPSQHRPVAETALKAASEKRFFHWELEFPEVFYGPRPGTTQAIDRLESAGFDAVIGNPPYDEPSEYYSDTTDSDKVFLSKFQSYRKFRSGRVNLYRVFLARGLQQLRDKGTLGYIVPMTILADDFSLPTREFLLKEKGLVLVEAFPQKDDPRRRIFPEAKLSTCILVVRNSKGDVETFVRTHPGRFVEENSPSYRTKVDELSLIFTNHIVVPTVSDEEWTVLQRAFSRPDWPRLSDVAEIYVGEVFDNAPNKKFLSDEAVGPLVLRGANIDRYLLREKPKQGKNRYLREKLFKKEKRRATKLDFLNNERIGLQRGAAVDNWRRLIACFIPGGVYSFDTVLLIAPHGIERRVLLGLFNSDLWEWRFRCTSTTNHVNEYELTDLLVPPCLLNQNSDEHKRLRSLVDSILQSPEALVRRSDCQMIPVDSVDFRIDDLIFRVYGLGENDVSVVKGSLRR